MQKNLVYNLKTNKIMELKIKDKIILKADESDFENQEPRRDCINKTVTIKQIFYDDDNNIDTFFVEENKYEWTLENVVTKQETTLEDKLKSLVEEWQERQKKNKYQDIAQTSKDEHNNRKFTYKAMATRDCWKELLMLMNSINNEK